MRFDVLNSKTLLSLLIFFFGNAVLLRSEEVPQKPVSFLMPGFRAQEIPVRLSNINNLRFDPEGKLTAVAYDGHIYLLEDTDNDGLEDHASPFWDKDTLTVPVGAFWAKEGLYITSKGKVSLFPDGDHDGKADNETVLVTNWPPTEAFSGNVDATAITQDKDGNLYFGLLTENYANPYRIVDGVSHYNLSGKRGTIQKFSPRDGKLETIATGIRVPYQLAFNKAGDLFVTDQEGETWCPNGNPLDELNHIQFGKNYGFPPRQPEYLPNLISEPPVVAFGPQHQSACGFVFNEPSSKQKLFGPPSWEDDAFVAGESRGKIWRVQLMKTPFGYLGREVLFARLKMLTTDVVISPRGDLYVSCQSGLPDWGTGPKGEGKIFKITYNDGSVPLPVATWVANPMEVRVAFDKPISPQVTNMADGIQIDFGEYVSPGDRLEHLKPPYKVVEEQELTPRGKLKVVAAALSQDQRTLILTTDPHPASVRYALSLPLPIAAGADAVVDVGYSLGGVEASWAPQGKSIPEWTGWFPHLDSEAMRASTLDSAEHEKLFSLRSQPGTLLLKGQLLSPNAPNVKYTFQGNEPFHFEVAGRDSTAILKDKVYQLEFSHRDNKNSVQFILRIETGTPVKPEFHVAYSSAEDSTLRPVSFAAVNLPWAPPHQNPGHAPESQNSTVWGDYEKGRGLFFSEAYKCSTCHTIRGEGGKIGPDLSNVAFRDTASVLRDIRDPGATINPDFVSYNVSVKNGEVLTGFLRAQSPEQMRLLDAAGKETLIPRTNIESQVISAVSLMPTGLLDNRPSSEVTDLLTFLCNAAPIRKDEALQNILKTKSQAELPSKDLLIILVANKQDHGPGQHDYPHWQTNFNAFLSRAPKTHIENAWEWPSENQFRKADAIVFYYWNRAWTPEKFSQLDRFLERGGGIALFHSATISDHAPEELARRIGIAAQPDTVKYAHTPIDLTFVAPTNHPITMGFTELHLLDEPYWPMIGDTNAIQVLATTMREGKAQPMIWTFQKGKGRVFASIPGHYTWTHEDPLFRILALRGIAWCAGENASRFVPLVEQSAPK
jgi:putative heme-binding domain-containing protein